MYSNKLLRAINLGDGTFENADVPTCIFVVRKNVNYSKYEISYSDCRDGNIHTINWDEKIKKIDSEKQKKVPGHVLGFSLEGIEILEKINKEIENSRPVKIYKRSDGHDDMAKMRANSSTMKKDLAHYNIVPAKTFILKPPEFLDKQYAISYIRGYFDGDGSIYLSRNNPIWRICSASRPILEWMRTYFAEEYGIINNKIYDGKDPANNDFYVLQYSSKDKLKKLYDVLYAPGGLYLQRKYDRFTQLVK